MAGKYSQNTRYKNCESIRNGKAECMNLQVQYLNCLGNYKANSYECFKKAVNTTSTHLLAPFKMHHDFSS